MPPVATVERGKFDAAGEVLMQAVMGWGKK